MSYQLINETLLMVDQKISDFLMEFSHDHPFQMALSLPLFRQQLKARILNKIPNRHKVYCDDLSRAIGPACFLGMVKERLLVEEEIRKMMPEIINDLKQPQPLAPGRQESTGSGSFQIHDLAWWAKIHTMIPCVTYYFGPFDSEAEAKQYYPDYVEDLKQEKAIGISVQCQKIQPTFLTIIDSPDDLKRDQQRLWQRLKQLDRKQSALQSLLQNQWNVLPGNFLVVNFDGVIRNANVRAGQLLNASAADLKGRSIFDYVPQPQIFFVEDQLKMMLRDGTDWHAPHRWSMELQTSSTPQTSATQGTVIPVDVEVTQQKDATGKVIGWYWLLHDMTPPHIEVQKSQASFSRKTSQRTV